MKISKLTALFLLLTIGAVAENHPVHVTFSNMEYKAAEGKFYISVRLFADDFTNILEMQNNKKINLKIKNKETDKLVDEYIKKHFRLKFEGAFKPQRMRFEYYIFFNEEEPAVQVFYSYKTTRAPQQISIMNTLMTDLYRDQKNLLIFSCKNTEKALKFDRSKPDVSFEIK